MKKLPVAVERILKKLGQPVTIKWESRAYNSSDSETLSTYSYIATKTVSAGNSVWERKLVAMLPRTERDLDGALLVDQSGKTFTIKTYSQTFAGSNVAMQEVILL